MLIVILQFCIQNKNKESVLITGNTVLFDIMSEKNQPRQSFLVYYILSKYFVSKRKAHYWAKADTI